MNPLNALNPEQKEAALHFEGPLLVLAGAGSGKTRVLVVRIANLVNELGVDPASILAVTFTNKAAGEMRARIRAMLGREPAGMWIGTFHSIGARLLRRHATVLGWTPSFTIYDADQAERQIARVLEKLNLSTKRWSPKAVHSVISGAKNQFLTPKQFAETAFDPFNRVVADVYPEYQKTLKDQNAFDFDDLLVKPVELFEASERLLDSYRQRFQFVLVDEYQDTNHVQYRLVEMLSREHGNLMVVGDDDQSIYRWRGADIRNILEFEQDFPEARVVRLEQNYRSTSRILEAANAVISQNVRRKGKTLRTDAGPGERITLLESRDERDEAEWIVAEMEARRSADPDLNPRDFTVLYRTNAQSRALEEALRRHDVPYQIVGGTRFYERREIMDVLAYLRLISNPRDNGAFDRILNYPRRGIGDVTRTRLLEWAAGRELTPLEAAERAREIDGIGAAATTSLADFAALIRRFGALASHLGVGELVEKLVQETRLHEALLDEGPEGEDRSANVAELVASAHDFESSDVPGWEEEDVPEATSLDRFLQKVALVADVDRHDPAAAAVTLMTAHNAKGLEFPVVFISGLEDGLFPLSRSFDEPEALEEERRLFYVAITRAERKLYMSHARMRRRAGEMLMCVPSSFLDPLPKELLDERTTAAIAANRERSATWRRGGGTSPAFGSGGGYRERRRERERASAAADEDSGLVVDYSYGDADEMPRFVKGERVRHPQFGSGVIRELSGLGMNMKAVIDFDSSGRKKVVIRYANLQKEL
ncbi:MAG TPA: UvrD-helicase domain-containing protein [Longimicrobiales bacterium]|nr:UvrD-helicase domain-containing protein [Longimicrobiales bacterium]